MGNTENTEIGVFIAEYLDLDLEPITEELKRKNVDIGPIPPTLGSRTLLPRSALELMPESKIERRDRLDEGKISIAGDGGAGPEVSLHSYHHDHLGHLTD